jgi:hypothetical protein
VLPACIDTYVNEKMYFDTNVDTNVTDTIVDENSIPLVYAVLIYALLEFTPLFLLLYISKRNYRLLREYSANRTHESIAIGVTLNRNNLTTKVSDCEHLCLINRNIYKQVIFRHFFHQCFVTCVQ